jgi:hypothetical protein
MSRRNEARRELHRLVEALCRDELSPEDHERLQELVTGNEDLRRQYVRYMHMHVCLRRAFERAGPECVPVTPPPTPSPERSGGYLRKQASFFLPLSRWGRGLRGGVALQRVAAMLLLAVGIGLSAWWLIKPSVATASSIAVLTDSAGCSWGPSGSFDRGAVLGPGRLELNAGMAELTFADGSVVLVEAPAVLELVGRSRGFLHSGRVVVRAPHPATGFVMETPKASVEDLGTEFGVGVGVAGDTTVQVFEGAVITDTGAYAGKQRLTAGQSVKIDAESARPEPIRSVAERFVRRMPLAKERGNEWLVPYNHNRVDTIHVVPVPGAMTIDGDLSDWDRSGQFFSACDEPYAHDYHVHGAMMYDAANLYIAAHVADPAPMCSVIDPDADPTSGWRGGGVQVRLSTDREAGYPIDAESPIAARGKRRYFRPQDVSNQLIHLTMWYHKPSDRPCLHIAYGMDFHGDLVNPVGFHGAFKKDADGHGYTMEYAIPWVMLNAGSNPPHGGDSLAACWNVHWSDEEGRLWRGYLIDVIHPRETGFTYQRAATWARAIYDLPR